MNYPANTIIILSPPSQDIPFLVLAGNYTQQTGVLNVASFFTLAVSLLGSVAYFVYLLVERNSIQGYFTCLRGEASELWAKVGGVARQPVQEPGPAPSSLPQRPHRSPYGSSESEQSDDSQVCKGCVGGGGGGRLKGGIM